MWELIANGINVAGNIASVGSFLSSYSIDRDRKIIENSVLSIEKNLQEYSKLLSDRDKPRELEQYLSNLLDSKKQSEINSKHIIEALQSSSKYQEKLINSLTEILNEVKNAYQFKKSEFQPTSTNFNRDLINDPFSAGISQFWDVSKINSFESFPNKIISSINTPILWHNPFTGGRYIGEMHNSNLRRYGVNINVPHYKFNQGGFIYDSKRGLYLPSILVV